ncbi:MAG TPA: NAD(P)-dependent oxidoreductase [Smithellaceae bacterium]|nr:NAD(P)-dependent oxidoreductase [Smithellaceae bacterium]
MKTILATTTSFDSRLPQISQLLEKHGLMLVKNPYERKVSKAELSGLLRQYRPIGLLAGLETIGPDVLNEATPYLRVISRVGVGWDNVDRKAAAGLGMFVYRTEGVLTQSVAELTLGLILTALRRIADHDRHVRGDRWRKQMGSLLQGKSVGIIGFGQIGQRVGELARAFGADIVFFDPQVPSVPWARKESLEDLLKLADIITLHASGNQVILGPDELQNGCRPGVVIVNTARGGLIDESGLVSCLKSGRVGYACLDVFGEEPYQGPLREMDNVVLTPHIGSYAIEARQCMELSAVENLIAGLAASGVLGGEAA